MELGPKRVSIYSRKEYEKYRERLTRTLYNEGLSAIDIVNNSNYKEFISNYVEKEVVAKKHSHALLGIVYRLANMDVQFSNGQDPITFPIINEYKGHDLIRSYYFSKDNDGNIIVKTVEVRESAAERLIIL